MDSQNSVCRMPHSSARWPPYGRPETSRLLKVDYYMLHVRMEMHLGGCAASSQDTDAHTGVGGGRRSVPWSNMKGPAVLTLMCIEVICRGFSSRRAPTDPQGAVPRLQRPSRGL